MNYERGQGGEQWTKAEIGKRRPRALGFGRKRENLMSRRGDFKPLKSGVKCTGNHRAIGPGSGLKPVGLPVNAKGHH
jgi:hypothetical protein